MDERTLRVLEFNRIRQMLSECAACGETKARCEEISPVSDIYFAEKMLLETAEAETLILKKGAPSISPVKNVSASAKRASAGGTLSMGELLGVSHLLRMARGFVSYFDEDDFDSLFPNLANIFKSVTENKKLEQAISSAIISDEEMADDASSELLAIRRKMRALHGKVREVLNDMIHSPHYSTALQEPIVTMRGDRYVIPVKSEHKSKVAGVVHDSSASGQTLFIEPMAAVEINNKLRAFMGEEKDEIERILMELSLRVSDCAEEVIRNYDALLELDFIFAKGKLSLKMKGSAPKLNTDGIINIKKGRHPLIDQKKVVPTDIYLGRNFDTLVITGPNTGGKTVSIKTVGLFTIMALSGLSIPCADGSEIAVFDNVFADIGDEQSIEQSLSTFSAHMTNIINILDKADYKSLILFDELCSGTDPIEGAALAVAILERARALGAKVCATTHYSEIKLYALSTDRVENAACEFDVQSLKPTYRLLIGIPGKSNAFAISRRLGLGGEIIDHAQSLIDSENTRFEDVISTLEKQRIKAEEELLKASKAKEESLIHKDAVENERKLIESRREKILTEARRDAQKIYEQAKNEADRIVREMQKLLNESASANRGKIEEGRRSLKHSSDDIAGKITGDVFKNKTEKKLKAENIKLGQVVSVTTMDQIGEVMTLPDKKGELFVMVGSLRIKTNVSTLAPAKKPKKKVESTSYISSSGSPLSDIKPEIDLRGQTANDALIMVDKYLDDAYRAHFELVSIIHGKGTGVLRSVITDMLRHHPHAKSFRPGKFGEGEAGVTVVEIK